MSKVLNPKQPYRKVLVKVIHNNHLEWGHFCYVPMPIWMEFAEATGTTGELMGSWLSKWAQEEFGVKLKMARFEDLEKLRKAIVVSYQDKYYELLSPTLGKARITHKEENIVKNWTSLHMKVEAKKYEKGSQRA